MLEDVKLKSQNDLLSEVQAEIEAELAKIPPEVLKKEEEERKAKAEYAQTIEDIWKAIEKEKDFLRVCSDEEFADWLIDQHHQYVETINWHMSQNFLDGETAQDKYLIVTYMYNLYMFLEIREIEHIRPSVAALLIERKEVDLVCILNVMGYIG
jgi:hypothetical protein